jgi:hypothetical protein
MPKPKTPKSLDREFDSLVAGMQTRQSKDALRSLSKLSSEDFRKAAAAAANPKKPSSKG